MFCMLSRIYLNRLCRNIQRCIIKNSRASRPGKTNNVWRVVCNSHSACRSLASVLCKMTIWWTIYFYLPCNTKLEYRHKLNEIRGLFIEKSKKNNTKSLNFPTLSIKVFTTTFLKHTNARHLPECAFLAHIVHPNTIFPSSSSPYEMHCVPEMPSVGLPASHSSYDPEWRRYNWVAVPALWGALCLQSWVQSLSTTLDSECHVKACGQLVLASQKVQVMSCMEIHLHCYNVQPQWATLDKVWES